MAVLKIYQAGQSVDVASPRVTQTGALAIPVGLATQQSSAFGSVGKVIKEIIKDNKTEEDANEASDIINGLNKNITDIYGKYKKSVNTADVENFAADIDNLTWESSNKNVDKAVNKYLRNVKRTNGLTLGKSILSNSISKSKTRKEDELHGYLMDITSSDPDKQIIGNRNYNTFFTLKENIDFYGEEELAKLKKEKDQLLLKNIFIKGVKAGNIDVLDNETRDKINAEFGDLGAKNLLDKARAINISKVQEEEELEKNEELSEVKQQLSNFTSIINDINNYKINNEGSKPTLDDIYDLYQVGELNSVQYNALIKFYTSDERLNDNDLLEVINAQIASARTAKDFDDLEKSLNNDKSFLDNIDPSQVADFAAIISKYKNDTIGITDYDKYSQLLKTHVQDVGKTTMSFLAIAGKDTGKIKQKSMNALAEYNRYIVGGATPEDAYLNTIQRFTEKDLPKPELVPQPIGFNVTDFKESLNKNPDNAFDLMFKAAVDKFKKDGNVEEYKANIERLDFIQDILRVRRSIFKNDNTDYLGKEFQEKVKKVEPPKKKTNFFKDILSYGEN